MSDSGFSKFNLSKETSKALDSKGWVEPTEIQRETIPAALTGRDIIGQARTGSGKTAAFGIPIIEGCTSTGHPQAIVLCPTRELAVQVAEEMNWLQGDKGLKIRTIYGGTDIERQAKELASGTDVIVGTPGRVIDMTKRSHLDLSGISTFCLDEADRMLDMGFFPDVIWIVEQAPNRRQTLLFSATFPQEVLDASEDLLNDPEQVFTGGTEIEVPEIEQRHVRVGRANKLWVLGRIMLTLKEGDQMLVFTNTKRMADMLVDRLDRHKFESVALHGDMPQNKRERILSDYRDGKHAVLIATDVAARGIDIDTITHVVNYDLPDETEAYVHRIGRTGRMGRSGVAWSLVTANDVLQLDRISSTWNLKIPSSQPPDLPKGVDRDPVRKREDWDEVSDSFGMVRIRVSVGRKEASKREFSDWLKAEAKLPDIAIGDILQEDHSAIIEIHVEKAGATLEILKRREWEGSSLEPELLDRPAVAFNRASMLA
jgi:ATP-dependent RNA helicase DeaD